MKLTVLRDPIAVVSFAAIIAGALREASDSTFAFLFDSVGSSTLIDTAAVTQVNDANELFAHNLGGGLPAADRTALDADGNVVEVTVTGSGTKWKAMVGATNLATEAYATSARVNFAGIGEFLEQALQGNMPTLGNPTAIVVDQVNSKVYAIPAGGAAWDAEPSVDENPSFELTEFRRSTQGFFEEA